ncbi:hypothetical protein PGTUg99_019231 [Puccinia graminis f. sp. tritici]|uniref:Secreted protein n=2 Tax=Puccinia graminis f. sp. tritici TaxID=56615 RepID=A0A5B0M5G8_PUCGR|nr:hypothetical protein PGTUg99_019231 [Puccinia graminis f. sp. tritici]
MIFGTTVIFGLLFIMALPPDSLASRIACVECGDDAYERITPDYPRSASCDEPISATEVCRVTRTKMYYRCRDKSCGAISVKNKQCPAARPEGCKHETSRLYLRSEETVTPPSHEIPPSQEGGPSEEIASEMIGNVRYFHFFE